MTDGPGRSLRLRREARTVELMIRMHCRGNHAPIPDLYGHRDVGDLCPDCAALLEYSLHRLQGCRFGGSKPTCARCAVHCFRRDMREKIRTAMRYSGPRMTYRHPYLAVRHMMDRRREPDGRSSGPASSPGAANRDS
jgi:hypothetical protein